MNMIDEIRTMSQSDLAGLGLRHVAYVKPVTVEGYPAFAIHAADGTAIAVMGDRDGAVAAIREHELEVAPLH
jgi:hypothetical protein